MNIAGAVEITDPGYRYRMPPVLTKIEGRSKYTVFENAEAVAKALHRDGKLISKFLSSDLCTRAKFEKNGVIKINGEWPRNKVQNSISKFIEIYVLCPVCRLPETDILFKKDVLVSNCKACGALCKDGKQKIKKCRDVKDDFTEFVNLLSGGYKNAVKKIKSSAYLAHEQLMLIDMLKEQSDFIVILKKLYDDDVLEEEAILEWNDKSDDKKILEPFVYWLQNADSE